MMDRRFLGRGLVLLLGLSLVLVACGGESAQSNEDDPTGEASAPADPDPEGTEASADGFPEGPLEIIVPSSTGGGMDAWARFVTEHLDEYVEVNFRVANIPGAGGSEGARVVLDAEPDGHTLLFATASATQISPSLNDVGYTPQDFRPVSLISQGDLVLAVHADSDIETFEDLIAQVEENPGTVTYGHAGVGTTPHLAMAALLNQTGWDMIDVPFDNASAAVTALLGKNVDVALHSAQGMVEAVEAGSIRAIAITTPERSAVLPDTPTVQESGIDFSYAFWRGFFVPADTPDERVEALNDIFRSVVEDEDFLALVEETQELAYYGPEEAQEIYDRDLELLQPVFEVMKANG